MNKIFVVLALALFAHNAFSQAENALTSQENSYEISLAQGELAISLAELQEAIDVKIVVDDELLDGLVVNELQGSFSVDAILTELLENTGLEYRFSKDGTQALIYQPQMVGEVGGRQKLSKEMIEEIQVFGTPTSNEGYMTKSSSIATKVETDLLEVAQGVSTINLEFMEDISIRNLTDALDYIPGVFRQGYEGPATSRGFSLGYYDYRRDGMRIFTWSIREPVFNERIQYLRGPASVLYGEGSPGGMVNLVTKQPQLEREHKVTAATGNFGFTRVTFDSTGPINDGESVLYRLLGAHETSDNVNDNDETRIALMPIVTWIRDDLTLTADTEIYYEKQASYAAAVAPDWNFDALIDDVSVANPGDEWINWNVSPGLRADWDVDDSFSVHSSLRVTKIISENDTHRLVGFDPASSVATRLFLVGENEWWEYQSDSFIIKRFDWGDWEHSFVAGFEISKSTYEGDSAIYFGTPLDINNPVYGEANTAFPLFGGPSESETDRYGAYIQNQFSWNDKWHFVAAVRFDEVKLTDIDPVAGTEEDFNNDALSPKVGVVYKFSDSASLYLSWGDSFQAPSAGQILEDGSRPDPITTESIETGVKWNALNDNLAVTLGVFHMNRVGELQGIGFTGLFRQLGETESRGVEFEVSGNVNDNWDLKAGVTYLKTEILNDESDPSVIGNEMPRAPNLNVSLWNKYTFDNDFGVGLGIIHMGDSYTDRANTENQKVPDYTRVDAGLYYDPTDNLSFSLFVENVADETYVTSAFNLPFPSATPVAFATASYGRNYRLSASYSF